MRCRYCFYRDEMEARQVGNYGMMTEATAEKLIEAVFAYDASAVSFIFQGGEPTLAGLSFFRRFLALETQYNLRALPVYHAIQTNGLLVDDEWAAFFAENGFLVGLSVDGPAPLHDAMRRDPNGEGTHAAVLRARACLARHSVPYNALCVVHAAVAEKGAEIYRWFQEQGFSHLQFIPCLAPLSGEGTDAPTNAQYADFLTAVFCEYYKDYFARRYISVRAFDNFIGILLGRPPEDCSMGGCCTAYFTVEADGSVYPCDFYVLDEWRMGNLCGQSLEEMRRGAVMARFLSTSAHTSEECRSCRWYALCRGGCRREREPFSEGEPALFRYCAAYRSFFEKCFPKMLEIAKDLQKSRFGEM